MQELVLTSSGLSDSGWRVSTAGYAYTLLLTTGAELLAFHWHPFGSSAVKSPHLHIGNVIVAKDVAEGFPRVVAREFGGAHIPTGTIALRDVLGFVIDEFGVAPRRPGWRAILDQAGETFALDPSPR